MNHLRRDSNPKPLNTICYKWTVEVRRANPLRHGDDEVTVFQVKY